MRLQHKGFVYVDELNVFVHVDAVHWFMSSVLLKDLLAITSKMMMTVRAPELAWKPKDC